MGAEAVGVTFRPANGEDSARIAELFRISSGGVADYVWSTLAPEYPGLTLVEIGARRYARRDTDFSYQNCVVAERDGEVVGMMHGYRMEESPEPEEPQEPGDPILEPYARLEAPGSFYVSGMAVAPELRGAGLGTRLLEFARDRAQGMNVRQLSLLAFEQNEGAVRLYRRDGFAVVDRAPVVPHEMIRYAGDVLLMTAAV